MTQLLEADPTPVSPEAEKSYEVLSEQAFKEALADYALYIDTDWKMPEHIGDEEKKRKQKALAENIEEWQDKYEELETVGEISERKAAFTVAVPVAVRSEDPEQLVHLMELITKAQRRYNKPVDVILWTNARYTDNSSWEEDEFGNEIFVERPNNKRAVSNDALQKYEVLQRRLEDYSSEAVRIRTALQVYDQYSGVMSNIRSDQMQAIAMDVLHSGGDFLQPVLWLDVDTAELSEDAFIKLEEKVRSGEVLFPHLDLGFDLDWVDGPLQEQDDATKAVAVNEFIRRIEIEIDADGRGYYEESGMACSVGAYLASGGVRLYDAVNEADHLVHGVDEAAKLHGGSVIPQQLMAGGVLSRATGYLEGVETSISGRRLYEVARREGIRGLIAERIGDGTDYELFEQVRVRSSEKGEVIIRKGDLYNLLSIVVEQLAKKRTRAMQAGERVPAEFDKEHQQRVKDYIESLFV